MAAIEGEIRPVGGSRFELSGAPGGEEVVRVLDRFEVSVVYWRVSAFSSAGVWEGVPALVPSGLVR